MNGSLVALLLVALLGFIYVMVLGYGVKYSFTGQRMFKYAVVAYLVKILLFIGCVFAMMPFVQAIATHVDTVENINYLYILGQWGWMALWLVVTTIVEAIFAFVILIPAAKTLEDL